MSGKCLAFVCVAVLLHASLSSSVRAASLTASADDMAMVTSANPSTVWDPKGAVMISGPTSSTEYALMHFNTASIVSQLNTQYPSGWTITSVGVMFASNFPTAGVQPNNAIFDVVEPGSFTLNWLSNSGWELSSSGGVTWNNLNNYVPGAGNSNIQQSLGTFNYKADGTSPLTWSFSSTSGFLTSIANGGVSIIGTPSDTQVGYLFNTATQGNPAVLDVTAQAVPEPGSCALALAGLGMIGALARRRRTDRTAQQGERGDG